MKYLSSFSVAALALATGLAASAQTPKIGVAVYKFDDTFMSYVRNSILDNAKGKASIDMVDSQNAQPTQNDQVDQFLAKKMAAIAINPVDRTAASAIIDKAKAKNVPVVFFNREPLAEDMKKYDKVYYVGAKAEQSGLMQGQIAVDYFKAHPEAYKSKDKIIHYVMLKGEPGHQDAELRTTFSIKAITDVDLVLCNNDDMALGAIEALRQEGYFTGSKFMPVVGVDATAPALQALSQGTLLGTVLNDAKNQGKATFDLSLALAEGKPVTSTSWKISDGKFVWVPYQKVTKDNYKQFQ